MSSINIQQTLLVFCVSLAEPSTAFDSLTMFIKAYQELSEPPQTIIAASHFDILSSKAEHYKLRLVVNSLRLLAATHKFALFAGNFKSDDHLIRTAVLNLLR